MYGVFSGFLRRWSLCFSAAKLTHFIKSCVSVAIEDMAFPETLSSSAKFDLISKNIEVGGDCLSLLQLIVSCASVQVFENDGFPQRICETCKDAAIKSYLFKLQCEYSHKYLNSIINNAAVSTKISVSRSEEVVNNNENIKREEILSLVIEKNADNFKSQWEKPEENCITADMNQPETELLLKSFESENIRKRTCPYCNKIFQYRTSMLKHKKKHNAPPKTCNFCNFQPSNSNLLSKHMEQMHSHLKTFFCSLCNKSFFKKANLRLHVQMHSGVKKHTCEICGLSFVLRGNLSVHRRLHTGERPYTCSVCGRGFTQQSALRSHEAGHSDKRDHVCQECGAAFSRAGALRNHQKRHLGTRPFECAVCGKTFTFSSERKRHMMIHSGDKNFECEVCGRRFSRNTNLKVHKRIHTGETPHVCEICGKGFIQAHCLRTHLNTHQPKGAMM